MFDINLATAFGFGLIALLTFGFHSAFGRADECVRGVEVVHRRATSRAFPAWSRPAAFATKMPGKLFVYIFTHNYYYIRLE